ncbi:TauD/TfdA family dioxygenase [Acidisphaera sp. S103]|uniref:TauD/TfdA dioxygenase family protein n=1 Tax=Acidisphaera sp. S103 TaxID=1747223 RepID=UPI00131AEE13|nr:TauD/TfdA family dioxygenase [Acidisphaera sp. S103]
MAITIKQLHPLFCAEIGRVDTGEPMDDATFAEIQAAFEEHSVLVFHDQTLDDEKQIAFSRRFGPLETAGKANPAAGTHFARQSNLDIRTGTVIPPEDRRMVYQKGNYLWHSDSSFKAVPSLCSLLSARVVPPEGGNTEFASMRAAYDALPDDRKRKLEGLVAEHSLVYSRETVSTEALTPEMKAELPGAWQAMVRVNPVNGRKAVYAGAHASHVIGSPRQEGRALIQWLNDFATQPRFCYSHAWLDGDLVIWDNRATLHRATAYDTVRHKRLMQRTTVGGDLPTVKQPERYELAEE